MSLVSICRVDSYKIAVVEDNIVEPSTRAWVDGAKEVLTAVLPDRIGDTNDNANNFGAVPVGWVGDGIDLVIDSKIVKILTKTEVGNTEKILTKTLLDKVKDADNVAANWELEK